MSALLKNFSSHSDGQINQRNYGEMEEKLKVKSGHQSAIIFERNIIRKCIITFGYGKI
jgi:hypothetical protein